MNIQKNEPHSIGICNNYKDSLIIGINVLRPQCDVTSVQHIRSYWKYYGSSKCGKFKHKAYLGCIVFSIEIESKRSLHIKMDQNWHMWSP